MILHSLSLLQRQGKLRISQEQEEKNNGAYGNRSWFIYTLDKGDIVRGGTSLDMLDKSPGMYRHHFISSFRIHYHSHHHHHPYRRDKYLPKEFKKVKSPTFDGEMNNLEDVEAWLFWMNNSSYCISIQRT